MKQRRTETVREWKLLQPSLCRGESVWSCKSRLDRREVLSGRSQRRPVRGNQVWPPNWRGARQHKHVFTRSRGDATASPKPIGPRLVFHRRTAALSRRLPAWRRAPHRSPIVRVRVRMAMCASRPLVMSQRATLVLCQILKSLYFHKK